MSDLPIVVVGAGAAGSMAAIFAAERGAKVILLERTSDGGRKILISGGGRCNILPSQAEPSQFFTASSPNSLKKILLSWPLTEQKRFFEDTLGVPLVLEKETGKLFPASNRARDVREALYQAGRTRRVEIRFDSRVVDVEAADEGWIVKVAGAEPIRAGAVILAAGGLSVPNTGSDGFGLSLAKRLGHVVNDTYPALTPLTVEPPRHAHLAGISLHVTLSAGSTAKALRASGGFLFTHRGYSGPSILDVSHVAVRQRLEGSRPEPFRVQWTPLDSEEWDAALRHRAGTVRSIVRKHLPDRLADTLIDESGVEPETPLAELPRHSRLRLVEYLNRYPLEWTGDEGYKKAEVTGGGVALSEINPMTLESRIRPGLFFCGEMLDAFGPIGGYNFLWSWATGKAAGAASRRSQN